MAKARKSDTPRAGTPAREKPPRENPLYVRELIRSLRDRAAQGDAEAVDILVRVLARHPAMRATVPQLHDLCVQAEEAWVAYIAGRDRLRDMSIREDIARMRGELLGDSPSVLDQVMVSNVITAYLAHQHAVIVAARPADPPVASARDRKVESALRRFHLALKEWALLRGKAGRGLAPLPGKESDTLRPERTAGGCGGSGRVGKTQEPRVPAAAARQGRSRPGSSAG